MTETTYKVKGFEPALSTWPLEGLHGCLALEPVSAHKFRREIPHVRSRLVQRYTPCPHSWSCLNHPAMWVRPCHVGCQAGAGMDPGFDLRGLRLPRAPAGKDHVARNKRLW